MQNDWILDVLADLKAFASSNGLRALAEQLDDTTLIAAAEIASEREEVRAKVYGDKVSAGPNFGDSGRHQRA